MFGVCKYHKKTISLHQRMTEKSKNKVYINMYVEFNKKSHNYQPTMKYYALSHDTAEWGPKSKHGHIFNDRFETEDIGNTLQAMMKVCFSQRKNRQHQSIFKTFI